DQAHDQVDAALPQQMAKIAKACKDPVRDGPDERLCAVPGGDNGTVGVEEPALEQGPEPGEPAEDFLDPGDVVADDALDKRPGVRGPLLDVVPGAADDAGDLLP